MDLLAGVTRKTRVVDFEPEIVEVLGDEVGGRLLLVETEGEGLDSAKEEEGVEGGESVADGVDGEGDALSQSESQHVYSSIMSASCAPWRRPRGCSR
jgi:hypothetical protein